MRLAAWVCVVCALCACGDDGTPEGEADAGMDASMAEPDGGGAGSPATRDDGGADAGDAAPVAPPAPMPVCSQDGFCWELPTPQGETLRAVWAAAGDDIWAVGDGGLVLHFDGIEFRREPALTEQDLLAIHGSRASDVWAVGKGGVALHYDGDAWSMQDLGALIDASGGAMTGVLNGVFAVSEDDVWAVGHSGVAAVIIHYDGESWSNQALGLMRSEVLHAIWGTAADRIWAVGANGLILAWDGTQWAAQMSPTRAVLSGIHGLTDHDVWAVGDDRAAVHWDGTRWRLANMGLLGPLYDVRVDIDTEPPPADAGMPMMMPEMPEPPPADAGPPPAPEGPWKVWAFGDMGRVYRWNGTVWAELPSGSALPLYGAVRLDEGKLLAVGERGQMTRFDGDARKSLSQGSRRNYLALWGDGETLWAVGDEIARRDDDEGWSTLERPIDRSLYGVWGDGDAVWAVGTAGTIVRLQDGEASVVDVEAAGDTWLRSVYGAGNSLWIVGHGGRALINAAGGFVAIDTKSRANLLDVWGDSDDLFWAVGEAGTVLRWDGTAWLQVPTGPMGGVMQNLRAVWGSAADDVWVVGTESTILHWNGRRFEDLSRGERYSLNDIWGRGPDDLYAVGTGGVALHYDGDEWYELETGTMSSLQSVFGDDQGRIFAAGLDGVILVLQAE